MRTLAVGGAGFIGIRVVEKLLEYDNDVVVMSRNPSSLPSELLKNVKTFSGDIRCFSDVMQALYDNNIDKIIHVAYSLTSESESHPYFGMEVNNLGTNNIFEAARLYNISRVVFASSIAAYSHADENGDRYVDENEKQLNPQSIYGASKVFNELMATKFEKNYGTEIISHRISAVYGAGREDRGVTAWFNKMLDAAFHSKSIQLQIKPDQLASFISVNDVAEQLVKLASKNNLSYRIYNSGGITCTPFDFYKILYEHYTDMNISFNNYALRWPYPPKVDGTRLQQELQYQVSAIEEGIREEISRKNIYTS